MNEVPAWFTEALSVSYTSRHVQSDDCLIEYYQWGRNDKPLLLMVHGNGGHANWWDFIAPSFMDHYCVCAIHLAGMGNSGHRSEYRFETYARDLVNTARHAGYSENITLVGHSMGGVICMRAAEHYPEAIKALVIIDTPMVFRRPEDPEDSHKPPPPTRHQFSGKKYYPDFETALSRFRLIPPQECENAFLVEHVGRHSIAQFEQGWSWKFDDGIYFHFRHPPGTPPFHLENIQCPLAYLYADDSALVPRNIIPDLHELLKNKGPVIEIHHAHHHVLLDQPLQLIERIREILSLETFR
jgi:pimeloyl-ACP methyl ester carboxylesterase